MKPPCQVNACFGESHSAMGETMSAQSGGGEGQPVRRVLVVEDDEDTREVLKDLLEMWGHQVETAKDGEEGLARLLELRPDVALVDVGLPKLDGYEVARKARADGRGARLFLVALTGYGGADPKERALEAGFDLHVVKPVDPARLTELLERRWQADGVEQQDAPSP